MDAEAGESERQDALAEIAERWSGVPEIQAARGGKRLVTGEGNPTARLVLVGEAPGAQEDRAGRPFVGPAGQILDAALERAEIDRGEIWITNSVKFRPTAAGAGNRLKNRAPTREEMARFRQWVLEELAVIRPRVVVCLGATAARTVLGREVRILSQHGEWFDGPTGIPTTVAYHPAFLLRRTDDYDERFADLVSDLRVAAARAGAA